LAELHPVHRNEIIMETDQATSSETPTCSICGGSGELVHIDEDVGCRITVPCWACQNTAAISSEDEPR